MSSAQLFALSGAALFLIGVYGLFACPHLVRKILAANVMGSGVFLVFNAMARRTPAGGPDPVPQAMVLTGVVVAVSATALALALACRLSEKGGTSDDGQP